MSWDRAALSSPSVRAAKALHPLANYGQTDAQIMARAKEMDDHAEAVHAWKQRWAKNPSGVATNATTGERIVFPASPPSKPKTYWDVDKGALLPLPGPVGDPGNAIRSLLSAADDNPFLFHKGLAVAPNPAYGKKHGLEWAGDRWAMPKANPNQDLERQALELELEKRRRDMEKEDSGLGDALRGWLAKRLGDRT